MNPATGLIVALALALAGCVAPRPPVDAGPPLTVPQGLADAPFAQWLAAQRQRIEQARGAARQRYHDDELACWRRFAVNDCLRDARLQRRQVLDALRSDEQGVNAAERERRTGERLRAIEDKREDQRPQAQ